MKLFIAHTLAATTLLACCLAEPALAEIYSFTDEDGAVHFSNVPADSRYVLLDSFGRPAGKKEAASRPAKTPNTTFAKAQHEAAIDSVRVPTLESAHTRCGIPSRGIIAAV
jgi:hypothetical protein